MVRVIQIFGLVWTFASFNTVMSSELTGVELEEVVTLSLDGKVLRLNGPTERSRSAQSLYIGGFYMEENSQVVEEILKNEGAKRFTIYCNESKTQPETLLRALNLGLVTNHSERELAQLQPAINQFNEIWKKDINQGDKVWIDFIPSKGTVVTINGEKKKVILGKAFYQAFLKSWIGDRPINRKIKRQLLGVNTSE